MSNKSDANGPASRAKSMAAYIFCGLLCLPTLLSLLGRLHWRLDLLSHFPLHQAIGLSIFVVTFLLFRRYRLAVCLLCCLLFNLTRVGWAYLPARPAPPAAGATTSITLFSSNVLFGNQDYDAIKSAIQQSDADVVGIVELTPQCAEALRSLSASYPYSVVQPAPHARGIGIWSKHPIENPQRLDAGQGEFPTMAVEIHPQDGAFLFVESHPSPPVSLQTTSVRNHDLQKLSRLVANSKLPVVVAGDLNITPWSPYFRALLKNARLRDTRNGWGNHASWPTHLGILGIPIDHVLVTSHWTTESRTVKAIAGADHRAVTVKLRASLPSDEEHGP